MHKRSINFQQNLDRVRADVRRRRHAIRGRDGERARRTADRTPSTRSLFPSYPLSAQGSWTHFPMCRLC